MEYTAPFRDDKDAVQWLRYPSPPDRLRRMEIFVDAYGSDAIGGGTDRARLAASVIDVQRQILDIDARLAAEGVEPQATWATAGRLDDQRARITWSQRFAADIRR